MSHLLIVAAGGALGAMLRHLAGLAALRMFGAGFPWGTLAVNVAGSLAMGLFAGWLGRRGANVPPELRLFVAVGLLGGFTTFSAFSLEVMVLWERGVPGLAALYAGVSLLGAVAALGAGLWVARAIL